MSDEYGPILREWLKRNMEKQTGWRPTNRIDKTDRKFMAISLFLALVAVILFGICAGHELFLKFKH